MRKIIGLLFLSFLSTSLFAQAPTCRPGVVSVYNATTGQLTDFTAIKKAIEFAPPNSGIWVGPGIWDEVVHIRDKELINFRTFCNAKIKGLRLSKVHNIGVYGFDIDPSLPDQYESNDRDFDEDRDDDEFDAVVISGSPRKSPNAYVLLQGNLIHNGEDGVRIDNAADMIKLDSNEIRDNKENGLTLRPRDGTIVVSNNKIHHNGRLGIRAGKDHILLLRNNAIWQNGAYGLYRKKLKGIGLPQNITFTDNLIVFNNGEIKSEKNSIDLANYRQILNISNYPNQGDIGDSGNMTTAGDEGPGVSRYVPKIQVPNVTNLLEVSAEAILISAGFTIGEKTKEYSETVTVGNVIRQFPAPGSQAPLGSPVNLVISLGSAQKPVPNIIGLTEDEAKAIILSAGFTIGEITSFYSDAVPIGRVSGQYPGAGSLANLGYPISFQISLGLEPVVIPDLVNLIDGDAIALLISLRLTLGEKTYSYSETVPKDYVISQSPEPGLEVLPGARVDIEISLGPQEVPVPNVVGLTKAEAEATISSAGFIVGGITSFYNDNVPAGYIAFQYPEAGSMASPGSQVFLNLSIGPEPIQVPNVVGLFDGDAIALIIFTGLIPGERTYSYSDTVPLDHVISQSPEPGLEVLPGVMVNIIVSLGPQMVPVPDIVGLTEAEAETALVGAGFLVGEKAISYNDNIQADHIISQFPSAGSFVLPGSSVNFEVSLGPQPVYVPSIENLTEDEAISILITSGLTSGNKTTEFSDVVAIDHVTRQDPAAGSYVLPGTKVDYVLSLGPARAIVPNLLGLSQADAESYILAARLTVGTISSEYSDTVPKDMVSSQNPTSGMTVSLGTPVDFYISLGTQVPLPPDPGEDGMTTIAGVDSDNDGIRDDIQRWIYFNSPDKPLIQKALSQFAKDALATFNFVDDKPGAIEAIRKELDSQNCASDVLSMEYGDAIRDDEMLLLVEINNTIDRFMASRILDSYFSGQVYSSKYEPGSGQDCSFPVAEEEGLNLTSKSYVIDTSGPGTTVFHINGMMTSNATAISVKNTISDFVTNRIGKNIADKRFNNIRFVLLYQEADYSNADNWQKVKDFYNQLKEAAGQTKALKILNGLYYFHRILSDIIDPMLFENTKTFIEQITNLRRDYAEIPEQIKAYKGEFAKGRRIIIAPHSQGCLFANLGYLELFNGTNSLPNELKDSIGIIAIGPATNSFADGRNLYAFFRNDILAVIPLIPTPLPNLSPAIANPFSDPFDFINPLYSHQASTYYRDNEKSVEKLKSHYQTLFTDLKYPFDIAEISPLPSPGLSELETITQPPNYIIHPNQEILVAGKGLKKAIFLFPGISQGVVPIPYEYSSDILANQAMEVVKIVVPSSVPYGTSGRLAIRDQPVTGDPITLNPITLFSGQFISYDLGTHSVKATVDALVLRSCDESPNFFISRCNELNPHDSSTSQTQFDQNRNVVSYGEATATKTLIADYDLALPTPYTFLGEANASARFLNRGAILSASASVTNLDDISMINTTRSTSRAAAYLDDTITILGFRPPYDQHYLKLYFTVSSSLLPSEALGWYADAEATFTFAQAADQNGCAAHKTFDAYTNTITETGNISDDTCIVDVLPGQGRGHISLYLIVDAMAMKASSSATAEMKLTKITFDDGTVPEDVGMTLIFSSGMKSPNISK